MTATVATELSIHALGRPARQGSKAPKGHTRDGRCILVEADPGLPQWRKDVTRAAKNAMTAAGWLMLDEACEVFIVVHLPRPKSVTREYPCLMSDGDGDKYARAIFDALTLAGVWKDDSRAVDHHCRKRYAEPGQPTGARIVVRALAAQGAPLL